LETALIHATDPEVIFALQTILCHTSSLFRSVNAVSSHSNTHIVSCLLYTDLFLTVAKVGVPRTETYCLHKTEGSWVIFGADLEQR